LLLNKKLRDALEFYANRKHYEIDAELDQKRRTIMNEIVGKWVRVFSKEDGVALHSYAYTKLLVLTESYIILEVFDADNGESFISLHPLAGIEQIDTLVNADEVKYLDAEIDRRKISLDKGYRARKALDAE